VARRDQTEMRAAEAVVEDLPRARGVPKAVQCEACTKSAPLLEGVVGPAESALIQQVLIGWRLDYPHPILQSWCAFEIRRRRDSRAEERGLAC
jgi:hypothetical protein